MEVDEQAGPDDAVGAGREGREGFGEEEEGELEEGGQEGRYRRQGWNSRGDEREADRVKGNRCQTPESIRNPPSKFNNKLTAEFRR